jgi:hypothetical protein
VATDPSDHHVDEFVLAGGHVAATGEAQELVLAVEGICHANDVASALGHLEALDRICPVGSAGLQQIPARYEAREGIAYGCHRERCGDGKCSMIDPAHDVSCGSLR